MLASSASKNRTIVRSRNAVRLTRAALQTAYVVSEDLGTSFAERLFTTPRRHARPTRERAILASARELVVDVKLRAPRWNGTVCSIAAWRWGRGPTVLLVHGWEGRGSQLGAFVEPLVAAGMSVVAFDAPGHGDSPEHRLYLTDLADCIADVAAAVGPLHAIIAHSFGAAAALLAHSRHGVTATRNVMVAPNVLIDDALRRFAKFVGLDDNDRGALEQRLAEHTGVGLDALAVDRLAATREGDLLVLHDRTDREVPFIHGERLAAAWPNAELRATDGLGHRRILRDASVITAIVEFVHEGIPVPTSDLVREVDRLVDAAEHDAKRGSA
ncbi:MAG: putative hydrolase [Myxococcales bacterium]|nr:putative hydrolase [Myxococcales bacterium]